MFLFHEWWSFSAAVGALLSLLVVMTEKIIKIVRGNAKNLTKYKEDIESKRENRELIHTEYYIDNEIEVISDKLNEIKREKLGLIFYLVIIAIMIVALAIGIRLDMTADYKPYEMLFPEYAAERSQPVKTVRVYMFQKWHVSAYTYSPFTNQVLDFLGTRFDYGFYSSSLTSAFLVSDVDRIPFTRLENNIIIFENVTVGEYVIEINLIETESTHFLGEGQTKVLALVSENPNMTEEPLLKKMVDSNYNPLRNMEFTLYGEGIIGGLALRTNDFGLVSEYVFIDTSLDYFRLHIHVDSSENVLVNANYPSMFLYFPSSVPENNLSVMRFNIFYQRQD